MTNNAIINEIFQIKKGYLVEFKSKLLQIQ